MPIAALSLTLWLLVRGVIFRNGRESDEVADSVDHTLRFTAPTAVSAAVALLRQSDLHSATQEALVNQATPSLIGSRSLFRHWILLAEHRSSYRARDLSPLSPDRTPINGEPIRRADSKAK